MIFPVLVMCFIHYFSNIYMHIYIGIYIYIYMCVCVYSCCLVTKLFSTLCNPMDWSTPGLPVPHHLPEFAQVHIHWVGDVIQLSPSLPPSSPFAFNLSQHWGLFQWVSSSHQVTQSIGASASASVFPMNIQSWLPWGLTGLIPLQSKGLSRVFFNITVQKHQFFSIQPSLWSNSHICMWLLERP